jgi:hypothetical protein
MSQDMSGITNGKADTVQVYARHNDLETISGDDDSFSEYSYQATGSEIREIKRHVDRLETRIDYIQEKIDSGKASPENLYQVIGEAKNYVQSENLILKIRELLQKGLQHLDRAYSEFDEEIERESEVDLFFSVIRRLSVYSIKDMNFEDAINALLVSLQGNVSKGYSRQKITALRDTTTILIDNIFLPENKLNKCLDALEDSGFDLTYPLKGIDLDELL